MSDIKELSVGNWIQKKKLMKQANKKLCECGEELKSENMVLTSIPPQYPYTCPKCGKRYIYRENGTRWDWDKQGK